MEPLLAFTIYFVYSFLRVEETEFHALEYKEC